MGKKTGKAGRAVSPVKPGAAEDADLAEAGKMAEIKAEQYKTKSSKYGSQKVQPFKPSAGGQKEQADETKPPGKEEEKTSWIEIELVGEDYEPIPGEKFRITLPDGTVAEGTLDEKGFTRLEGFEKGNCKVCFPDLDKEAWEQI